MTDLNGLRAANARRWANARLMRDFITVARRLIEPAAKIKYQAVAKRTGVPWFIIAVIHEREASQNWACSIAQGDRFDRVSVHVPAGRGPFPSWEEAAVDALVNCEPKAALNHDWSPGGALTILERYNGLGYASKGVPSPYIWAGTDQYRSGKYVRDGVYDPNAVDSQLGCAGLLLTMSTMDLTVKFGDSTAVQAPVGTPAKPLPPSITNPAPGSLGAFIASIFNAIFKRKT
jgi:lysozyme family protein